MASIINATTTNGLAVTPDNSGELRLQTNNGTTAITIDTSQNVGIGTSSPATLLHLASSSVDPEIRLVRTPGSGNLQSIKADLNDLSFSSGRHLLYNAGGSERMRITSGGNVLIGTTTDTSIGATYRTLNVSGTDGAGTVFTNSTASRKSWIWNDATDRLYCMQNSGGVYLASAGTSWTSTSDERLKENLVPITDAANKVASLRAVTGNYIADESKKSKAFLIAQDIQKVLPEAVDATDPEKLGVQYTDVIPLLVAAIQELKTELDTVKAELQALKGTE